MNIAICDNEPTICKEIKNCIMSASSGVTCDFYEFHSGDALLSSKMKFDMVFLDIELGKGVDGLETAQKLQNANHELILIFISGFTKYVSSSFYFHTFQFLLKPIDTLILQREFLRGIDKYKKLHAQYMFKHYYEEIVVEVKDIVYIESQARKLLINMRNNNVYTIYGKIGEQYELENTHSFIRVHRSYLVNPRYIIEITKQQIILKNHKSLPLSRKMHQKAVNKYHDYLLRQA